MKVIVDNRQAKCSTCSARHFCQIQKQAEDMNAICPREVWDWEWEQNQIANESRVQKVGQD